MNASAFDAALIAMDIIVQSSIETKYKPKLVNANEQSTLVKMKFSYNLTILVPAEL